MSDWERYVKQAADVTRQHAIKLDAYDRAQDHDSCRCGRVIDDWDEHWAEVILAAVGNQIAADAEEALRWRLAQDIEDEFVGFFVADEASPEQWKLREVMEFICPGWPLRAGDQRV